jgi:hypothetical protein
MNGVNGHPTVDQWRMIQEHLKTVFDKRTPNPQDLLKPRMPDTIPVPYYPPTQPFHTQPNTIGPSTGPYPQVIC